MIKLNLAYSEKSDIVFSKINYPDGQNDVRILNFLQSNKTTLSFEDIKNSEVEIVSRFNNFIDLEFILAATQSLRELGCEDISLRIPSLFSARCDRKFVEGGNSYLKDITAPILNLQNYSSVTVVDGLKYGLKCNVCVRTLMLFRALSSRSWSQVEFSAKKRSSPTYRCSTRDTSREH